MITVTSVILLHYYVLCVYIHIIRYQLLNTHNNCTSFARLLLYTDLTHIVRDPFYDIYFSGTGQGNALIAYGCLDPESASINIIEGMDQFLLRFILYTQRKCS